MIGLPETPEGTLGDPGGDVGNLCNILMFRPQLVVLPTVNLL